MSKLQMAPPIRDGAVPRFFVRVHRPARPPLPWTWAIHQEGRARPCRRSIRAYRSADEAWAAGQAMLARTGNPLRMAVPEL
jgi:hypothetical protein